jgi:hemolysin III
MKVANRLRSIVERFSLGSPVIAPRGDSFRPAPTKFFASGSTTRERLRMSAPISVYTPREERANILTHAFGIALSIVGLVVLVSLSLTRGDIWHVVGTGVFGFALVLLYATSTLYHLVQEPSAKLWWRRCDHAGIFFLIAGSYTPFLLVNLRGPWGWSLFAVVWTLGIIGVALKFWYAGHFRVVSTLIYIAMGWLVLVAFRPLLEVLPLEGVWLLVIGGFLYTGGTVFYLWKNLPYHHAVWHLFVLAGSVCHWFAVFRYVVPGSELITD